jgi:hypothetical protein
MNIDFKQPWYFLVYALAVVAFGALVRIGWELGGKLWQVF